MDCIDFGEGKNLQTLYKIFVSLVLILFVVLLAFQYLDELRAEERRKYLDNKAREILQSMTWEEKIGQVIHLAIPGKTLDPLAVAELEEIRPGGIIHFGSNLGSKEEILRLNQDLQKKAKEIGIPPFLISTDQEGGRVFRVRDGVSQFPGAMAIGQTNSEEIGEMVGFITSYELHKLGINFLLAPSLDINNNPENPVINTRSFGSDAERVRKVGGAYERGARKGGAIPVIKHFPGHGDTNIDSHLGLPVINKTLEELEAMELIPFRSSIQAGAPVVMTAHILYPKIDPEYPATLSKRLLSDLLRNRLGFQGVIITDAMEMHAISKNYEKTRPGVKALLAGADILLLTSYGEISRSLKTELSQAWKEKVFEVDGVNLLDEAVYRQIRLKLEYGLYTDHGFPGIENENLLEFFKKEKEERESRYASLTKDPQIVFQITLQTIRAYPQELDLSAKNPHKDYIAYFRNKKYIDSWKEEGGISYPIQKLAIQSRKYGDKIHITDFQSEKELKRLLPIVQKNPNTQFIFLYPGNPFIQLPQEKNLTILFAFSLTETSYSALAKSLWRLKKIPKVELVLKH